ncbi:hypothetical protein OS493_022585 [Desmophyllum pertusum]|uniref:Uncharacterized protein n=1 Tax=Desmophyllum pertusum TaxID=174260 RepID=A0A9W9YYC7_9CNID|nr:hypothetical protein OS493_022585 [Desmophyllum pertusum]
MEGPSYSILSKRIVNDAEWTRLVNITDISVRVYIVKVKKAEEYEFVVTATNTYGESSMKDKIKRIKLLEVSTKAPENQTGSSCDKTILHIVYVSVILLLLIIIILLLIFIVRRMHSRTEKMNVHDAGSSLLWYDLTQKYIVFE